VCVSQVPVQHHVIITRRRGNSRATVRYRCAPATIGRLYIGADDEFQHAWIVNLSETGAGFVLPRAIPSGSSVLIQIRAAESAIVQEVTATVVHCTDQLLGDWMIGCVFDEPLSPEMLDTLL
jgi:hypothetical protein